MDWFLSDIGLRHERVTDSYLASFNFIAKSEHK